MYTAFKKKFVLRKIYGNYNILLFTLYMITIIKVIGKSKNDREEYCSVFGPVVGLLADNANILQVLHPSMTS